MKRSPLTRRVPLLRRPRKLTASPEEISWWYVHAVRDGGEPLRSVLDRPGPHAFEAHHIVPRQVCRRHGVPEWDVRNAMLVTVTRHRRHHSRHEPILRSELPERVFDFAAAYNLTHWLDRHYPALEVAA